MTNFDIFLLIIVAILGLYGFFLGFINALGSLLGIILATFIAGRFFQDFGELLFRVIPNEGLANIIAFFLLYILTAKLLGLIFFIINKIFNVISIIPFLKTFNRLLGGVLGIIEGIMLVGVLIYIMARFPVSDTIDGALIDSKVAPIVIKLANIIAPLLPDIVNKIQAII